MREEWKFDLDRTMSLAGASVSPACLQNRQHTSRNSVHDSLNNRSVLLFVTVCAKDRQKVFANPAAAECIVNAWKANRDWSVGTYVIMPDHIHFCCAPGDWPIPNFHRWVAKWKAQISRTFPGRGKGHDKRVAPEDGSVRIPALWQRDCWDTQLRQGESFIAKCDYIRNNPVRAGLVDSADKWPYQGKLCDLEWHDNI